MHWKIIYNHLQTCDNGEEGDNYEDNDDDVSDNDVVYDNNNNDEKQLPIWSIYFRSSSVISVNVVSAATVNHL